MDTLALKSELHILIDHLQDEEVLKAVKTLLGKNLNVETDFWNELSEEDKADIRKGAEDIKAGRFHTYEEVFSKYGL
jgi:predicted transcriptional regulator